MNNEINFLSTIVFEQTWNATQSGLYKLIEQQGGSRSSKTWSDFQVLFLDLYSNPMTTCTILRDTQKSCREIIETDWVKWLSDPMGRKRELEEKKITTQEFDEYVKEENLLKYFIRNKTNHTWTFIHNNSFIRFTGLDDENDAMGMTQDICWINEPYSFSHEVYKQLSQRTSKYIIFDWNPKQNHWIDIERKKDNTITLKSTLLDNPFCPIESRIQILSYQPLSQSEVVLNEAISEKELYNYNLQENILNFTKKQISEIKRCLYNEETESSSLYHWLVYGKGEKAEKPNRIYYNWKVIPDAEFDSLQYSSFFGMDFGLSSPSAMVEMKFDGDKSFFIKEILYKPLNQMQGTLSTELDNLKIPKHIEIICDVGNELNKTEMQKLRNSGYNVLPAMKGAGSILSGIETIQKSTIYYTKSSKNIENEYDTYSWRIAQGVQLDEPEQTDDHLLDAMKYVISWYRITRYLS